MATHNQEYLKKIAKRILDGNATKEEKLLLDKYYDAFSHEADIEKVLTTDEKDTLKSEIRASVLQRIAYRPPVIQLYKRNSFRISIAAALLVFISAGLYFLSDRKPQEIAVRKPAGTDIAPGGNKAILILADGSEIVLDTARNGILAKRAGLVITKTKEGQLVYNILSSSPSPADNNAFNTIQTPKGGQYQVNLPDGSKVWLNSASSLKFPTAFAGSERRVVLTGEAYFEIAENKKKPFKVVSDNQIVEVLGTHFNVNSYNDESAVKTTLLKGSVKITTGTANNVIEPGEQAQVKAGTNQISVILADIEEVTAWKNGFFYFKDADIKTIMRQLSRWYNVDVEYEGLVPHRVFSGKIYRNMNASQVLDILRFTNVHFRIEGNSIIVTQ